MTRVWPALWPPWKRATMSACSDNQSTILPFPSSPHWAPTTTTLAISYGFPAAQWFQHDLFGKPVSTFPDHVLACPAEITAGGRSHARQPNRIKEAARLGKQEGSVRGHLDRLQAIDIPGKFVAAARRFDEHGVIFSDVQNHPS